MDHDARRLQLLAFLALLEKRIHWTFDLEKFDDRLRLQKYVHLAQAFGIQLPYSYGIHLRGPYSPDLAQDYYSIEEREGDQQLIEPLNGNPDAFVSLVEGRDTRWLEIAATIQAYALRQRHASVDEEFHQRVVGKTIEMKGEPVEYVESVYSDLLDYGVIPA